ncbi:MAG TPA: ABC transporter permease [Caulobacterales bacterium]|nr:ABC transporter permease [Caulobacterales bacterium]
MDAIIDLARGVQHWRTSYAMGVRDIELRYKRSLLGPFWISASLVASILALSYLFSSIFKQEFLVYTTWLSSGLVVWTLLQTMVGEACGALVEHGPYLQNVPMPLSVIALRVAIRNGVVFLHNFVAVAIVMVLMGAKLYWTVVMVVPGAALVLFFGFCLTLAIGPACARFRDIPQVVTSMMQILFFVTPIIWMPHQAARPALTDSNPLYHLIELVRAPMLGHFPSELNWTVSLVVCAGMAVLALISVSLTRKRVALWL